MREVLSQRAFHDQLASLLEGQDAVALRLLLHAMADECHPQEREAFVDRVRRRLDNDRSGDSGENLDTSLDMLEGALEAAKKEAEDEAPFIDDDDDVLGPFRDVMPLVDTVLQRIGDRLERGSADAALDAYETTWTLLDYEDEFGRGPRLEEYDPDVAREHAARYLRAVYCAVALDERPVALCEAAERVRRSGFPRHPRTLYVGLGEIVDVGESALKEWDATLARLVGELDQRFDVLGDAWLREATQARGGVEAMADLATRDGMRRPLAWLDWAGMAVNGGDDAQVMSVCHAAQHIFPQGAWIWAELADMTVPVAALHDPALSVRLRYAAFLADPAMDRLLELWEGVEDPADRDAWIMDAADQLMEGDSGSVETQVLPRDVPGGELIKAPRYWHDASAPAALGYLLAGRWDAARELAEQAEPLGWSGGNNARSVVFLYALVALSARAGAEPGPTVAALWKTVLASRGLRRGGLARGHVLPNGELVPLWAGDDGEALAQRYRNAVEEMLTRRPLSAAEAQEWMTWCMETAKSRCDGIVVNKHRGAYERAARAIVACYETARARGEAHRGQGFVQEFKAKYPRHSAFQRALREAMARSS